MLDFPLLLGLADFDKGFLYNVFNILRLFIIAIGKTHQGTAQVPVNGGHIQALSGPVTGRFQRLRWGRFFAIGITHSENPEPIYGRLQRFFGPRQVYFIFLSKG